MTLVFKTFGLFNTIELVFTPSFIWLDLLTLLVRAKAEAVLTVSGRTMASDLFAKIEFSSFAFLLVLLVTLIGAKLFLNSVFKLVTEFIFF